MSCIMDKYICTKLENACRSAVNRVCCGGKAFHCFHHDFLCVSLVLIYVGARDAHPHLKSHNPGSDFVWCSCNWRIFQGTSKIGQVCRKDVGIGSDFMVVWNSQGDWWNLHELDWVLEALLQGFGQRIPKNQPFLQSLFFCKLSLSDSVIPHWFPLYLSHFPLALLTVSYSYAACLTQRPAFCSSPSAYCSVHLFTHSPPPFALAVNVLFPSLPALVPPPAWNVDL